MTGKVIIVQQVNHTHAQLLLLKHKDRLSIWMMHSHHGTTPKSDTLYISLLTSTFGLTKNTRQGLRSWLLLVHDYWDTLWRSFLDETWNFISKFKEGQSLSFQANEPTLTSSTANLHRCNLLLPEITEPKYFRKISKKIWDENRLAFWFSWSKVWVKTTDCSTLWLGMSQEDVSLWQQKADRFKKKWRQRETWLMVLPRQTLWVRFPACLADSRLASLHRVSVFEANNETVCRRPREECIYHQTKTRFIM